ncbi:IclR family transcriptional regulator [Nocardioides alcanivorans]|uniref:IclR family transcriptional regulator n=1 Tax=Nocardioides alcanivorans TaxID=2897352 RepID=UPI001F33B931|nr:IclR family transcriptional regulator [Nocardioides alcanivorans]
MPPTLETSLEPPGRGNRTLEGLERALDVLMLFAQPGTDNLGISEIARSLDLPKATVHRIVTTLCGRDFLELDATNRRYKLGPSWLVMGSTYIQRVDMRDLARDTLRELSAHTNETSTLSIRHGYHRVYLDQVTPKRLVIMSVQVGDRFPLHAGGTGKAFLAHLDKAEQDDYMDSVALVQLTDQTTVDREALIAELDQIRERGYSISFGERQEGAGAVAAPLLDFEDKPVGVISVCGPVDRIQPRVEELGALLLERTGELSARLGHPRR